MKCQVCNDKKALHWVVGNSFYLYLSTYVCCACHEMCDGSRHKNDKEKANG
jgi:hypothetical protein